MKNRINYLKRKVNKEKALNEAIRLPTLVRKQTITVSLMKFHLEKAKRAGVKITSKGSSFVELFETVLCWSCPIGRFQSPLR